MILRNDFSIFNNLNDKNFQMSKRLEIFFKLAAKQVLSVW